jgi:hypothetical protein
MEDAVKQTVQQGLVLEQCQAYNTSLETATCNKTCHTSTAAPKGAFGSKLLNSIAEVQVGRVYI